MARSRRFVRGFILGSTLLVVLAPCSCGQLTGLADDYRYDLDAGGAPETSAADPSTADASDDAPHDASADSHAPACTAVQTEAAQTALTTNDGSNVPSACRTCMADSCCTEIQTCAKNANCAASMKCIFDCQQKGGGKAQCLNNCAKAFATVVGTCVQNDCNADCQLL
jgi:hypothetical protein